MGSWGCFERKGKVVGEERKAVTGKGLSSLKGKEMLYLPHFIFFSFFRFFLKIYFYAYGCFTCLYVCTMCLLPREFCRRSLGTGINSCL